ncbi:methionyl-tRNA formyltransferase protein [Marine Group I thaumarchaeote SCGC AAA799-E16]|uniref:Methionyl-tRNA formyltransferase protein n=2 Tax=Marine Group I TaxID=905826 RepID=A0A081S352_9ARCH|nr:methionyl-tRNA formyltransferase protein [Marine Group I thaumarchaeote SCGC AAA799-E16]
MEQNGLPISILLSSANQHDSTKFIDVIENISTHLDETAIEQIVQCYADKGYDAKYIREYLKSRNIADCIPHRNYKTRCNETNNQNNYNKTRYVVERFFAWLKCGFRKMAIRYERISENYESLINIASFLMYCRVLG